MLQSRAGSSRRIREETTWPPISIRSPANPPIPRCWSNVPRLVTAYFAGKPDPTVAVAARRVRHLGASRLGVRQRLQRGAYPGDQPGDLRASARSSGIDGPLFVGIDTHALSEPALASALEVFAANDVEVMIDAHDGYTPTPVISHAILTYNKGRTKRPRRRRRDHAVAQSARGWRLQIQSAERRSGRYRRHRRDRARRERAARGRPQRASRRIPYERALQCVHTSIATITSRPTSPTSATSSTWRRSARPG